MNWRTYIEAAVREARISKDEGVWIRSLKMDAKGRKTGVGYTATNMAIDGLGGVLGTIRIRRLLKNAEKPLNKEFP